MEGFTYFKTVRESFIPKTPAAALKALEAGLQPGEAFIYRGTSIKPLDDEPLDLDEIARVVEREDLDIQTNLLLMRIFEKLVKSQDAELALFAAESINAIENRYNSSIETLKKKMERENDPALFGKLANLYFELSQLRMTSIKNFYLKEAYACLVKIAKINRLTREDAGLLVRVLLELKLYDQAMRIIDRFKQEHDPVFLLLEAELEFKRRNFLQVIKLCTRLFDVQDRLDERGKAVLAYWIGD